MYMLNYACPPLLLPGSFITMHIQYALAVLNNAHLITSN